MTLIGSTVSNNTSQGGGGTFNGGTMTLIGSAVSSNNTATYVGGGIFNEGTTTLTGSTVSNNTAADGGGGIYDGQGSVTLNLSIVSGNTATSYGGGGIYAAFGGDPVALAVTNSLVTGNHADNGGQGGGIYNADVALTLTHAILSFNTATATVTPGGGLYWTGAVPSGSLVGVILNTPDNVN